MNRRDETRPQAAATGKEGKIWAGMLPLAAPFAAGLAILILPVQQVAALPAFAEQTGLSCQACHVGGFGPQLTPLGRQFKLDGYTMRSKASVPASAMVIGSLTHTKHDQPPPLDGIRANNNFAYDQGSLFLAGGVGKHLGGFAQFTYDGVAKHWSWDNLDIRAVTKGKLFGADTTFGLTLNNSPSVQDAWNTTPAWGAPYTDTAVSGTPGAALLIDGALAQNTLGLGAYAWIDHKVYVEVSAYSSPAARRLDLLGADPRDPGDLSGLAPYGRLVYQTGFSGGTLALGAFGLAAKIYPARIRLSGLTDNYTDLGFDASWQKQLSSTDVLSAQGRYIREASNLRASCELGLVGAGGMPDCARGHLDEWRGEMSYRWHDKIGATLGAFSITGDSNPDLYGGPAASPDSNGIVAQLDYTPWGNGNGPLGARVNVRFGAQFTAYGKFDGARYNYDGAGANASDNDALRIYSWLAF